ncbi:hypothetical protein FBU31_001770 [Coemansia sp. 'formosensis']|nr:hypothetical protein FBU31_001770 [Coemansia sp. 'formosensis']
MVSAAIATATLLSIHQRAKVNDRIYLVAEAVANASPNRYRQYRLCTGIPSQNVILYPCLFCRRPHPLAPQALLWDRRSLHHKRPPLCLLVMPRRRSTELGGGAACRR